VTIDKLAKIHDAMHPGVRPREPSEKERENEG
jgi:hypothetical protein